MKKTPKPIPAPIILPNGRLELPVSRILPNPEQPRKAFGPLDMENLAQSIRENGVILPIVVEEAAGGMFILHDGERRLRAARIIGLPTIPSVITPPLNGTAQEDRLVRALVTNVQRADLGPIEEAKAFQRLKEMGYSASEVALKIGLSVFRIHSRLKLLELDTPIQDLIERGKLSKDSRLAEALLAIPDTATRLKMAASLSERNATIKAGAEACERLVIAMQAQKIGRDETPALRFSQKHTGSVNRPVWDAFAQVGRVPPWPLLELSVRKTCDRCALRDSASDTTCKGCALVEVLVYMIGSAR